MTAAESTYTAEFHSGYRATLTVSLKGFRCEWSPDLPRSLKAADRDALLRAYRVWRDECLARFAEAQGLAVHCFEVDGIDCIAFSQPKATS